MVGWGLAILFSLNVFAYQGDNTGLGIAPDCSEEKITVEQLLAHGQKSGVDSMRDFLRAIPPRTLQTFTFVHESKSFQHHLVDEKWPRVLRMSADGKITISFVCNPRSQDYDRVEILYYLDPPVAQWRSVSLDFRKTKAKYGTIDEDGVFPSRVGKRIHHNEVTCAKCHSPSGNNRYDLRPVIPQYKTWDGFYGSDDDVVHINSREHRNYSEFWPIAMAQSRGKGI